VEKTFTDGCKIMKFVKVFSLETLQINTTDQAVVTMKGSQTKKPIKKKPHPLIDLRRNMPEEQVFYFVRPYADLPVGSKRVRAVVLLVAWQVYGSAGGSTIVALFLKLIEADCDGLLSRRFC
jgi:hypothetical protein